MIGKVFTTLHSKKEYRVIKKHRMFEDTWGCYPTDKEPPYKENLIDYFSTDFIQDCLTEKNENEKEFIS